MEKILLVVHAEIGEHTQIGILLRSLRRLAAAHTHILLFGDLAPSDTVRRMEDGPLVRALQSGIMSMDKHAAERCMLLVRERKWDDAARAYLGKAQKQPIRSVIAQLLQSGKTDAAFRAASVSPSSLSGIYSAVLLMDAGISCTPDMPGRMADALFLSGGSCVTALVLPLRAYNETLLTRLSRLGFSLSAADSARNALIKQETLSDAEDVVMFDACSLASSPLLPDTPCPKVNDCLFVRQSVPTLHQYIAAFHLRCLRKANAATLLPLAQVLLLACSTLSGMAELTAAALFLPELFALLRPRLWPAVLVRTAFLPLLFACALDGLSRRLLAQSACFRIELPRSAFSPFACCIWGGLMLFAALIGVHALVPLMTVSILWLSAPLIARALHSPTHERIPLSDQEQRAMLQQAKQVFSALPENTLCEHSPALCMLALCAMCMLGEFEADEAARRIQTQLVRAQDAPMQHAYEQAAILACAQYVRERLSDCDSALRDLPAQLEAYVSSLPVARESGLLSAFLAAARSRDSTLRALDTLHTATADSIMDLLLLPPSRPRAWLADEPSFPLTHPHSYLRSDTHAASSDLLIRFLFISVSALGQPFGPLLLRSPITGPYAPMLSMI